MKKVDAVAVVAILLCCTIVLGEYLTYSDIHEYGATAEWKDDAVDFTVSSNGSDAYNAVLMDSGGRIPVSSLMILHDDDYNDRYGGIAESGRVTYMDQDLYGDEVRNALAMRGFTDVDDCDFSSLKGFLDSTMDRASGKGLLVTSYALPAEVYDGTAESLILKWISNGGTLYWAGSEIGSYCADDEDLIELRDNQILFFGKKCLNVDGPVIAETRDSGGFCEALALKSSGCMFSVDTHAVEGSLALGYASEGYSTISFVPFGNGQICIFGGPSSLSLIEDIAQVIASEISYTTRIAGLDTGVVTRSTASGSLTAPEGASTMYIFTGGYYLNYGCVFHE